MFTSLHVFYLLFTKVIAKVLFSIKMQKNRAQLSNSLHICP